MDTFRFLAFIAIYCLNNCNCDLLGTSALSVLKSASLRHTFYAKHTKYIGPSSSIVQDRTSFDLKNADTTNPTKLCKKHGVMKSDTVMNSNFLDMHQTLHQHVNIAKWWRNCSI